MPVKAQVTIGDNVAPHKFSILELITKNKDGGLRMPQLTNDELTTLTEEKLATSADKEAAKGLCIYNIETGCLEFWNGKEWISLCSDILPPPPTLEVDPDRLFFAYNETGVGKTVTITTNQSSWDFSSANMADFSITKSGNTLTVSVTGVNTGSAPLTGVITITAGSLTQTISVTQSVNVNNVPGGGTPVSANTYIGAFWRASQTGERIIRITGIANGNAGAWTASVGWYDSKWNTAAGDGIIFSATATSDSGVTFASGENPADMNVSANDATYSVSGNASSVSGTVASGETIMFRIGCQQTFAAFNDATNPARYAVIVLSYANNTKVQKIFVRQGEGADYLMQPTDAINSGGMNNLAGNEARPAAVKFTPRNIKDTANNTDGAMLAGTPPNVGIAVSGGVFVDYPTQAGYMFRWNYSRQAFAPQLPATITGWNSGQYGTGDWVATDTETCPSGYRRPNDGSQANTTGPVAGSEMRQSLWLNPQTGSSSNNIDNSVRGYYADGFFDRRQITNGVGASAALNSSVSTANNQIAHIGNLFYNPTTNASLFFPAAGYHNQPDGSLYAVGNNGYYWSGSSNTTGYSWYLMLSSTSAYQAPYWRSAGFSVRCVKN